MNNNLKTITTVDTSPFKRLVVTIGELPSSFVESMTYYELLAWFTDYLQNTIIPAVNNNGEAVAELQEKYIELKNYVDTYFENLDVQEEINNKLDDMAESGQLTEIISAYLSTTAIWAFDNVAGMIASENLTNGSYARTLGYYEKSDGGESLYKIRTKTEQDLPDGMLLIAISDTLVAELIIGTSINSKQLGIKGDGITEESTKLNTFFAIDKPVDKILNNGTYISNSKISIKGTWRDSTGNNVKPQIIFDNASIKYTGSNNSCALLIYNMFKYNLKNISLTQDSSTGCYVKIAGCWFTKFNNCFLPNLKLESNTNDMSGLTYASLSIEYCKFDNTTINGTLTIDPSASGAFINSINFYNCNIDGRSNDYCVILSSAGSKQNISFICCDLSYCATAVFNVTDQQTGRGYVSCENCYFDSNKALYKDFNQNRMQFNFVNCILAANSTKEYYNIFPADYMRNVAIGGSGSHPFNLPTFNENYAVNGNFESETLITGNSAALTADSNSDFNKEWISSNKNINGRARKVTSLKTSGNLRINIPAGTTAPRSGEYIGGVRLKVTSCANDCEISLQFGGSYHSFLVKDLLNKEIILINNRKSSDYGFSEGDNLQIQCYIVNPTDFVAEFYEAFIIPGKMYIPNAPLDISAKME